MGERNAKISIPGKPNALKNNARAWEPYFAKVGVEGSNPFARSSQTASNPRKSQDLCVTPPAARLRQGSEHRENRHPMARNSHDK